MKKLSEEEQEELKEVFDLFDDEKKGVINIPEAIKTMKIMGFEDNDPFMFDFIKDFGDEQINFQQFKRKYEELINEQENSAGYQRIYDMFIENPDKDEIDITTLRKTCRDLGESFTDVDLQYILDVAGDGNTISFPQFKKFMEKKYAAK